MSTIDNEGARALCAAVIARAAEDYWEVCDQISTPKKRITMCSKEELERFFKYKWFKILADGASLNVTGDEFREIIKEKKKNGESLNIYVQNHKRKKHSHK